MSDWNKPNDKSGLYIVQNERDKDYYDLLHFHDNTKKPCSTLIAVIHTDYLDLIIDNPEIVQKATSRTELRLMVAVRK